jgi:hypothetical protein
LSPGCRNWSGITTTDDGTGSNVQTRGVRLQATINGDLLGPITVGHINRLDVGGSIKKTVVMLPSHASPIQTVVAITAQDDIMDMGDGDIAGNIRVLRGNIGLVSAGQTISGRVYANRGTIDRIEAGQILRVPATSGPNPVFEPNIIATAA